MRREELKEFIPLILPYKKRFVLAFISVVAANIFALALPWAVKFIVDDIIPGKNIGMAALLLAMLLLSIILRSYFSFLREFIMASIAENVTADLRNRFFSKVQSLSVGYSSSVPSGSLISGIVNDVESVKSFLHDGLLDFVYSFFNLFFILAVLFMLDVKLTLVSLIYSPVFAVAYFKLTPSLKRRHLSVREKYSDMTVMLSEVFSGMRVICGFSRQKHEVSRFRFFQSDLVRSSIKAHKLAILMWAGSEFFSALGLLTLLWFGINDCVNGRVTLGTFMAFYSYLGMLFFPVAKLAVINDYFQRASAAWERINSVLKREPDVVSLPHSVKVGKLNGAVSFERVSFSYDGRKTVLSDISFEVQGSQVVAIVGKSGEGKSTLISLLLRFYDPGSGRILIDGNDLRSLDLDSYRLRVAMVLQDDYLFSSSVKDNILYGRLDASFEDVLKASKQACAHEFITALPGGYDTAVGERGLKLSFGQRQRISIARALLRDPDILILDEATSNIDSATERVIVQEALANLIRGRTTFIIAHRLSTVTSADKIILLEDGNISESGTHAELLGQKNGYYRLWQEFRREDVFGHV